MNHGIQFRKGKGGVLGKALVDKDDLLLKF